MRAYTSLDGTRYDGAVSNASAGVIPFGLPGTPGASATASGTNINFQWSAPAEQRSRRSTRRASASTAAAWQSVANSGSASNGYGHSETHTIEVQAHNKAGWSCDRFGVGPHFRSAVALGSRVARGRAQPARRAPARRCAYFKVTVSNFPAGKHTVYCNATGPYGGTPFAGGASWDFPSDGSIQLGCYFGGTGAEVWVTIDGKDYEHSTW